MNTIFLHTDSFIGQLKSIETQINQGQLQQAAQQLNQLVKIAPRDPRLFLLGSRLAEAAGNPEGVLESARKAYELTPQWPVAGLHLAKVLAGRGEAAEAIALAANALEQAKSQNILDVELITVAAALAQRVARFDQALVWLRDAEKLSPSDMIIQHQLAVTQIALKDFAGARAILSQLLHVLPGQPQLMLDRAKASLGASDYELAKADTDALLVLEPGNQLYQYYGALAHGLTPKTQPDALIAGLFDLYAPRFDKHLARQQQHRVPKEVAEMIHLWHPDHRGDVLDLGCGTGSLGMCLGPIEGVLVGVDLSQAMIDRAIPHGVYNRFHRVNVLDALQATPGDLYHVITAIDTLNYVGDLQTVIPNAHRILVAGGRFVFTCETGAQGSADFALHPSHRYTHQRAYVQRLLTDAGFEELVIEDRELESEAGQPVQGFLVIARKQGVTKTKSGVRKPAVKSRGRAS